MLTFGVLFDAIVFALCIYFAKDIFMRVRSDVDEFRAGDGQTRGAIGLWWLVGSVLLLHAGGLVCFYVGL